MTPRTKQCFDTISQMLSGNRFQSSCRRQGDADKRGRIIALWSTELSGFSEREVRGGIFRLSLETGKQFMNGFIFKHVSTSDNASTFSEITKETLTGNCSVSMAV